MHKIKYRVSWQTLPVRLERELAVDNLLKLRLWLGTTQKYAIDEKGGRARNSSERKALLSNRNF